jgi:hypothetical protein
VKAAWRSKGCTFIVMDYVHGYELEYVWHGMSPKTKHQVIDQLKDYMAQLQALRPPVDGHVTSFLNGPLCDCSCVGLQQLGPFQGHDDFHQFVCAGVQLGIFEPHAHCQNIVTSHHQKYETKFTHGDPRLLKAKLGLTALYKNLFLIFSLL